MIALTLLATLVTTAVVPSAPARIERFALVVGYNQPPRADLPRLRYGDDDAVRWATLLSTFGARVELLTALDDESRQLYGDRAPAMAAPSREQLQLAMSRLAAGVKAAHAAGARTVFYFVYAGHGDVDNGEGYVALDGGRLTRRDLEELILGVSGADSNHVVVDACRSYYFVYDRGPGGSREPWTAPYFVSGAAARFRNTGFLLASSSEAPTHEWEEFQAGIFSHELRSGLLGSADVNNDGRISYDEISAFVHVANRPIRNARFRPTFVARAPADGDDVFLDITGARGGTVDTAGRPAARYLLEDGLGVRWADLHPGERQHVLLRLPVVGWSPEHFFFRKAGADVEDRIPTGTAVTLAGRTPTRAATLPRGAANEAYAQLFADPFDARAFARETATSVAAHPTPVTSDGRLRHPAALGTAAVGLVALGGFTALTLVGAHDQDRAQAAATSGVMRDVLNGRLATIDRWRIATGVTGALFLAGGAVLYLRDRVTDRHEGAPHVVVTPLPQGGAAALAGTFR